MFTHLNVKLQSSVLKACHNLYDVEFLSDHQTTLMQKKERRKNYDKVWYKNLQEELNQLL